MLELVAIHTAPDLAGGFYPDYTDGSERAVISEVLPVDLHAHDAGRIVLDLFGMLVSAMIISVALSLVCCFVSGASKIQCQRQS